MKNSLGSVHRPFIPQGYPAAGSPGRGLFCRQRRDSPSGKADRCGPVTHNLENVMRRILGRFRGSALAVLIALAMVARADDKAKKITLDQAPKAVQDAIKARFPGAEVTSVEKET